MKKYKVILIALIILFIIGYLIANTKNHTFNKDSNNNSFIYNGEYIVKEAYDLASEETNNNKTELIGEEVNIFNDNIKILDTTVSGIKYKLKVVSKDYTISYEHDIKADTFTGNKNSMDIISAIYNNTIISEFFTLDNGNVLMLYKSLMLVLEKISDLAEFKEEINVDTSKENTYDDQWDKDIGVMVGIKKPRELQEDGSYSKEEYRTLWIAYEEGQVSQVYEKADIIFPRMNGIWKLSHNETVDNNKHYEYFEVAPLDGKAISLIEPSANNSLYKSIKFVGNDYIAIEKYEGNNFNNQFNKYEIVPIDNINSNMGINIDEIYSGESKLKFEMDFNNTLASITNDEKYMLESSIDYSNFTMDRKDGKWILKGKIAAKNNLGEGVDFDLSLKPNVKLVNFNSLFIPWKNLIGDVMFLKDAFTAPNNAIALIQFKNFLAIYKIKNGVLIGSPLFGIPLKQSEEIIMAEWCSKDYIKQWQSAFEDGTKIENK